MPPINVQLTSKVLNRTFNFEVNPADAQEQGVWDNNRPEPTQFTNWWLRDEEEGLTYEFFMEVLYHRVVNFSFSVFVDALDTSVRLDGEFWNYRTSTWRRDLRVFKTDDDGLNNPTPEELKFMRDIYDRLPVRSH